MSRIYFLTFIIPAEKAGDYESTSALLIFLEKKKMKTILYRTTQFAIALMTIANNFCFGQKLSDNKLILNDTTITPNFKIIKSNRNISVSFLKANQFTYIMDVCNYKISPNGNSIVFIHCKETKDSLTKIEIYNETGKKEVEYLVYLMGGYSLSNNNCLTTFGRFGTNDFSFASYLQFYNSKGETIFRDPLKFGFYRKGLFSKNGKFIFITNDTQDDSLKTVLYIFNESGIILASHHFDSFNGKIPVINDIVINESQENIFIKTYNEKDFQETIILNMLTGIEIGRKGGWE